MVIGIECHARPRTLLQGCDCVCLVRLCKGNPGRELGAQGKQVPRGTSSPVALLPCRDRVYDQSLVEEAAAKCGWRQAGNLCESIAVAGKSESVLWAAFVACLSLVLAADGRNPHRVKAYMPGHPLWESRAFFGKSESGLWDAACCLPELVSTARCNKPAWSEILFAWTSPVPEREVRWRLWKEP